MSAKTIQLALALHNHQPVGNFPHIFEMAYQKAYLPFLDQFEKHPTIRTTLHYSGCLLEWMQDAHPECFKRLRNLIRAGRIELMGGGFYEPILVMLTDEDRHDQIRMMSDYLKAQFGGEAKGAWVPERVWEQSLTFSLSSAGVQYIILDDFHFKNAGLTGDDLLGYYLTEDRGKLLRVFPSSELLRYYIPFKWPEELVEYLRGVATEDGARLLVYGDDGEKFGVWPKTYEHVYGDHWLERFFKALEDNADWIHLLTLSEAMEKVAPLGKIYLPDASYREMTEWALPEPAQRRYEAAAKKLTAAGVYDEAKPFIRGGFWRNFKIKYPETNRMYGKMLHVSRKVRALASNKKKFAEAQRELFRGQCNCSYWHGVFGGLYLPHLRWAVYEHLIAAERIADAVAHKNPKWTDTEQYDLDLDLNDEIALGNPFLKAAFKPDTGGHMIEFDVRDKGVNLLGILTRRREAYHAHLLETSSPGQGEVKSIHDIHASKQPDLDKRLQYDSHLRESLVDYFLPPDFTLDQAAQGHVVPWGDFVVGEFEAGVSRAKDVAVLTMLRRGRTGAGTATDITKVVRLTPNEPAIQVEYGIRNTDSVALTAVFGVEFNLAMLSADESARFYCLDSDEPAAPLTAQQEFPERTVLTVRDLHLGIDVVLSFSAPSQVWVYPVQTVSQSESGFELVYQGSCIMPRWAITIEPGKTWAVKLRKEIRPVAR